MRYLILAMGLLVMACESEAEIHAKQAAYRAQAEAADDRTCIGYGLELGTPAYADCRLRLSQIRVQNRAARNAAILQWYGMQQRQQPVYTPPPAPVIKSPTNTTCQWIGSQMYCTTY